MCRIFIFYQEDSLSKFRCYAQYFKSVKITFATFTCSPRFQDYFCENLTHNLIGCWVGTLACSIGQIVGIMAAK